MGAEIDRLEVQVEAQATKANNQLDKLVGKLDRVSRALSNLNSSGLAGLSSGVSKFAQASTQLSNVKTADFTRLAKNIEKLSTLNTSQLYGAAHAMRTLANSMNSFGNVSANSIGVSDFVKSIGKLGGVNVQRAITNLPALATAMNDLMATLSKAPSVNRNIIDMTNALANLAAQGAKVGTAGTSLVKSVTGVGTAMSSTTKKARGFSSALGLIYQKYFWLMRGANKLWDSIENSMNYIEVLNYFDAAMQQVSANAGASSADAYFESFSSRAKDLTSKMTGFSVNDNGTLTATGNESLGINPTKLMNYQATFAQMSSSIGVASETSLLLSQALTEIGADLASVKNMDFDKVWKDMASGLAGMSRTLDKYGVNIRNVNLQQKLFDLGIEENITNLNQNDKALLRAIILLDSTKYAWGDLADTINQPANQMRLLDSNMNNLSRTIGNLFLPMVSNVLPYVNGLVIALQRLFVWTGNLLGIDISGITQAVGDSAFDIGELVGETDDLTGSLGEASKAADKLKKGIRGFDELNVISTQTDALSTLSGAGLQSGILDEAFAKSFSEYQKAWDEAFLNMENRANEFAGKIEKFLQPVKNIIEDFAIGDYFKAGQDTSNLVSGIFNFFADAIDNVDWYKIGENIGDYLAGVNWIKVLGSVGHFVWEAFKASLELWAGALSTSPIETALISMIAMPKALKLLASSSLITKLSKLANNIGNITGAFAGNNKSIILLKNNYPKLGKAVDVLGDSFQRLMFGVHYGDIKGGINAALTNIRNNLTGLQKGAITAIAGFAEFSIISNTFEDLVAGSENLVAGIVKIGGTAGVAALAMYTSLGPAGLAVSAITALTAGFVGFRTALKEQHEIDQFGMALDEFAEKANNLSDSLNNKAKASIDYVSNAGLGEIQYAKTLSDRYFELQGKISLTTTEKEEYKRISEELINIFPSLSDGYDAETGAINATREAIEKLIQQKLNEIKLSAVETQLKQLYIDRAEATKNLTELTEKFTPTLEKLNELYAEQEEVQNKVKKAQKNVTDARALQGFANEIQTINGEIRNMSKEYETAIDTISNATLASENIEKSISQLEKQLSDGFASSANYAIEGFTSTLDSDKTMVESAISAGNLLLDGFNKSLDEHSPSKETEKSAKYFIEGFSIGIKGNTNSAIDTINRLSENILGSFSKLKTGFESIGEYSVRGMIEGFSSAENGLYEKVNEIAENIKTIIKDSLDIHSPSRVMFSLGEFTMQGFQLGMENLYGNIQKSIENFGGSLQYEIAPPPKPQYAGVYSSPAFQTAEHNSYFYYENQSNFDTAETNMLLREILTATRAGHILECNGREIGRTVREQDTEFYDRTGKGMFEH